MVGSVSDRHRIGRIGRIGDELSLDEIGMGRHLDGNRLMMDWQISDGLNQSMVVLPMPLSLSSKIKSWQLILKILVESLPPYKPVLSQRGVH